MLLLSQGNLRFLKLLLSRRANWLQKDLEEMTPLHLATRHPSPKALALLLKHIGPGEVDTQDKNKVEGRASGSLSLLALFNPVYHSTAWGV